jgi:CDP-diacylglycerol--serine O-phosphatidyltransferase
VLRFDLLKPLKRPISNRLFGKNKTWRGAVVMFTGVFLATAVFWPLMPSGLESWPVAGALIGLGTVAGELPNSYLKRRLGIAPGERRLTPGGVALIVYDQADFVPGIAIALLPVWTMPLDTLVLGFVAVAAVHFVVNVIGYAIGARDKPI